MTATIPLLLDVSTHIEIIDSSLNSFIGCSSHVFSSDTDTELRVSSRVFPSDTDSESRVFSHVYFSGSYRL